jgi:hypothetical protein
MDGGGTVYSIEIHRMTLCLFCLSASVRPLSVISFGVTILPLSFIYYCNLSLKINLSRQGMTVNACNPGYPGGRNQEYHSSTSAWAQSSARLHCVTHMFTPRYLVTTNRRVTVRASLGTKPGPISKIKHPISNTKRAGGVAQVVEPLPSPEFNPSTDKKTKQNKNSSLFFLFFCKTFKEFQNQICKTSSILRYETRSFLTSIPILAPLFPP